MPRIRYADRVVVSVEATQSGDWQVVDTAPNFQGITSADFSDGDLLEGFLITENNDAFEVYGLGEDADESRLLTIANVGGSATLIRPAQPFASSNAGNRVNVSTGTHTLSIGIGAATLSRVIRELSPSWQTFTSADVTPSVAGHRFFKTAGSSPIRRFDDMEAGKLFFVVRGNADITIEHDEANILNQGAGDLTLTLDNPVAMYVNDNGVAVHVNGGLSKNELISTEAGKGASLVGVQDATERLASDTVEDALTEFPTFTELSATETDKGASLVGIEDAADLIAADNAEDAFAELAAVTTKAPLSVPSANVGGTGNAITVTVSGGPTEADGLALLIPTPGANTGAVTLAYNGGTASAIVDFRGEPLIEGTYQQNEIILVVKNTTAGHWQKISSGGGTISTGGGVVQVDDRASQAGLDGSVAKITYLGELGREGEFRWDSTDLSAEVAADTQQIEFVPPTGDPTGASGAHRRLHNGVIYPKWAGIQAGDAADASAALQTLLRYTTTRGLTLMGDEPEFIYRTDSQINTIGSEGRVAIESMRFDFSHFDPQTRVEAAPQSSNITDRNAACFFFGPNGHLPSTALTSAAARGATEYVVADPSFLPVGTWFLIVDTSLSWDRSDTDFAEWNYVVSVSGNTLTLGKPSILPYSTNARVYAYRNYAFDLNKVEIIGNKANGDKASIYASWCRDSVLRDVKTSGCVLTSTWLEMLLNLKVDGLHGEDNEFDGFGYTLGARGCFNIKATNIYGPGSRHAVSIGGSDTYLWDDVTVLRVPSRTHKVTNIDAPASKGAVVDEHGGSIGGFYQGITGDIDPAVTGEDAIVIQGADCTILDAEIKGGRHAILMQPEGSADKWNNVSHAATPTDYGRMSFFISGAFETDPAENGRVLTVLPDLGSPEDMTVNVDFGVCKAPRGISTINGLGDIEIYSKGTLLTTGDAQGIYATSSTTGRTIVRHKGRIDWGGDGTTAVCHYAWGGTYADANGGKWGADIVHESGEIVGVGTGSLYIGRGNKGRVVIEAGVLYDSAALTEGFSAAGGTFINQASLFRDINGTDTSIDTTP
ncbi:MAG: hypothetical protein AAF720_00915 [Pseudomonadota bacterium]